MSSNSDEYELLVRYMNSSYISKPEPRQNNRRYKKQKRSKSMFAQKREQPRISFSGMVVSNIFEVQSQSSNTTNQA